MPYQVLKRNLMFYKWKFMHINARDWPPSKAFIYNWIHSVYHILLSPYTKYLCRLGRPLQIENSLPESNFKCWFCTRSSIILNFPLLKLDTILLLQQRNLNWWREILLTLSLVDLGTIHQLQSMLTLKVISFAK